MLPAMAATLAGFACLRIGLAVLARPRYLPARELTHRVVGSDQPQYDFNDWVISEGVRDAAGKMVAEGLQVGCPLNLTGPNGQTCGASFGVGAYNWRLYQPADRFWLFQYLEAGIFVALAALLLFLALRRIRRIV
jgi:hypothetical protein